MLSCPAELWMEQLGILGKEMDLELVQLGCNNTRQHHAS